GGSRRAPGRQPVVAAPALARLLAPAACDGLRALEPVEQGIERSDVQPHRAVGAFLDQLADLVAVPGPMLEERQDGELGAPFLEFPVKPSDIWHSYICWRDSPAVSR